MWFLLSTFKNKILLFHRSFSYLIGISDIFFPLSHKTSCKQWSTFGVGRGCFVVVVLLFFQLVVVFFSFSLIFKGTTSYRVQITFRLAKHYIHLGFCLFVCLFVLILFFFFKSHVDIHCSSENRRRDAAQCHVLVM